ncbi:MAG TPA: aldose epimerase family protein [Vicinamibacterales bacterium]|nr:aldose epimerase family protein [Vicinamibacterales bacterium]
MPTVTRLRFLAPAFWLTASTLAAACGGGQSSEPVQTPNPKLTMAPFDRTPDNQVVDLITLRNSNGIELTVLTYGGVIKTLRTPDRTGALDDIVLGFDDLPSYLTKSPYFGCLIGRYGNRIAKGRFTLDGTAYTLATNNETNHLHGGNKGWDKAVWKFDTFNNASGVGVVLTHTSPDGDEGYPGEVKAKVTYTLTDQDSLIVDYEATTDKATVINLTQHSYFNLAGTKANDILDHELMLNAGQYTPVDPTLIPTGDIAAVEGTPFDFRTSTPIGARINDKNEQLARGKGYDHNWVLTRTGAGLSEAAKVYEPTTGRTLTISTTEPGIQFYSGNFLDGTLTGKGGRVYPHRSGFCLETQHYPDSPNHPNFPSTVLRPGETYKTQTVFTFGVQR